MSLDADYTKTESGYEIRVPVKPKKPFDVCSTIVLVYSLKDRLLYTIRLESKLYVKPSLEKMNVRVAEMAKSIGSKFSDRLKIEKEGEWYMSKFNYDVAQMLYCGIKKERESYKTLKGEKKMAKFIVELVDTDIKMNGRKAVGAE